MKKNLTILFIFLAIIYSCSKKVDCDNAQLCVKNTGTDTIHYCWGCNFYMDVIPPGAKACIYVGEIHISSTSESVEWIDFESDHGIFRIKVDDCYVEKEID